MESTSEGKRLGIIENDLTYSNISANRIHMTTDTKEFLDKTARFLIEKRGTMSIKVCRNHSIFFQSNMHFISG